MLLSNLLDSTSNKSLFLSITSTQVSVRNNALFGSISPFQVVFIIRGIGYRAILINKMESNDFQLKEFFSVRYLLIRVGFSYSVYLPIPDYIGIKVSKKERKLVIYGFSNDQVATFSHLVYSLRVPSVYTGRGIRYKGCLPRRKLGKKDIRKGRFF
jgi:large subunit ribosomal protein L6